jgi:hypothetical protein
VASSYGDRYENLGVTVGAGGQSDVFRVRDKRVAGCPEYALKRLKNKTRIGRFLDEIEALQRLDHLCVPKTLSELLTC